MREIRSVVSSDLESIKLIYEKAFDRSEEVFDDCEVNTVDILSTIPDFSGEAYIVINDNVPFFTEEEKECVWNMKGAYTMAVM